MYSEELVEEGLVTKSFNGLAEILISDSDNCKECSAKIYCKPGNSSDRLLIVKDPFGVMPGDKVRVLIKGSKILFASFLIYGIPLVLLLTGIFIGFQIFSENKELFSTLLAIGFVSIYSIFFAVLSKLKKISAYPEITFVSSKRNQL
jgi:sigma-E factor negative regulatory protein RseC